jgi:hypothetical protein
VNQKRLRTTGLNYYYDLTLRVKSIAPLQHKKYGLEICGFGKIQNTEMLFNLPIAPESGGGAGAGARSAVLHCGSGGAGASAFCCLHGGACGGFRSGFDTDDGNV